MRRWWRQNGCCGCCASCQNNCCQNSCCQSNCCQNSCRQNSCCQSNCCQNSCRQNCASCSFRESRQVFRDGQNCRSLYQRECSRRCGCGCGCDDDGSSSSGGIETVCYCTRVADVPMSTYYGPGYTEVDCCMTQNEILQEISDSLQARQSIF